MASPATYRNKFVPPTAPPLLTEDTELWEDAPPTEYDINSSIPLPRQQLETEKVRLEPLIPSLHGKALAEAFMTPPSQEQAHGDFSFYPFPNGKPLQTSKETFKYIESLRRRSNVLPFAIIDKATESLAGIVALAVDPFQATKDPRFLAVKVFPRFRGGYVFKHASFLVIRYTFEDLEFVRIAWRTPPSNRASQRAAEKVGLKLEGVIRCYEVVSVNSETATSPYLTHMKAIPGYPHRLTEDGMLFAMTIHDWFGGAKDNLQNML